MQQAFFSSRGLVQRKDFSRLSPPHCNKPFSSCRGFDQRKKLCRGSHISTQQVHHQLQVIHSAERFISRLSPSTEASYSSAAGNLFSRKIVFRGSFVIATSPSSAAGDSLRGKISSRLSSLLSRLSKASLPLFKLSSEGPCKASARDPALSSNLLVKGYAREGFNKRSSHHSINQTRYRKPTDMHSPPPNITT